MLRPTSVWLPSYLCGSLLQPFAMTGAVIRYYPVDEHLQVSEIGWTNDVRPEDFVLVIHYFGFPNRSFPADRVAAGGAHIVEDSSQALFLTQQFPQSAGMVYSPRKFLGVPDSGILVCPSHTRIKSVELSEPPMEWWKSAVTTTLQRSEFDLTGQPGDWYALFQRVEAEFPVGPYRASDLSRTIVSTGVDYTAIRNRRRENYARLLELLGDWAMLPNLDQNVVPLGFPVRLKPQMRDGVLRHLHAQRIYAPVHWPIGGIVPESFHSSHNLAQCAITLLCEQRCTLEDMDWQAEEFKRAIASASG
jgi:hypothetical protein